MTGFSWINPMPSQPLRHPQALRAGVGLGGPVRKGASGKKEEAGKRRNAFTNSLLEAHSSGITGLLEFCTTPFILISQPVGAKSTSLGQRYRGPQPSKMQGTLQRLSKVRPRLTIEFEYPEDICTPDAKLWVSLAGSQDLAAGFQMPFCGDVHRRQGILSFCTHFSCFVLPWRT